MKDSPNGHHLTELKRALGKDSAFKAKSSAQQDFEDDLRGPVKVGVFHPTACQPDLGLLLQKQTAARVLESWFHHKARIGDGSQQRSLKTSLLFHTPNGRKEWACSTPVEETDTKTAQRQITSQRCCEKQELPAQKESAWWAFQ